MELVVAFYLTSVQDTQDVLLKLGLPLIVAFLAGWIITKFWLNRSGIESTGFSAAATAALFAPVFLATYFFILQAIVQDSFADRVGLAILFAVLLAPTLLLVPVGTISLIRARRRQRSLHNWLIPSALAAWSILQVGWLWFVFEYAD